MILTAIFQLPSSPFLLNPGPSLGFLQIMWILITTPRHHPITVSSSHNFKLLCHPLPEMPSPISYTRLPFTSHGTTETTPTFSTGLGFIRKLETESHVSLPLRSKILWPKVFTGTPILGFPPFTYGYCWVLRTQFSGQESSPDIIQGVRNQHLAGKHKTLLKQPHKILRNTNSTYARRYEGWIYFAINQIGPEQEWINYFHDNARAK